MQFLVSQVHEVSDCHLVFSSTVYNIWLTRNEWSMLGSLAQRSRFSRRSFGRLKLKLEEKGSILVLGRTASFVLYGICRQVFLLSLVGLV
jgi:hypothetical protein